MDHEGRRCPSRTNNLPGRSTWQKSAKSVSLGSEDSVSIGDMIEGRTSPCCEAHTMASSTISCACLELSAAVKEKG